MMWDDWKDKLVEEEISKMTTKETMPETIWAWKPEILYGEYTAAATPHSPATAYIRKDVHDKIEADKIKWKQEAVKVTAERDRYKKALVDIVKYTERERQVLDCSDCDEKIEPLIMSATKALEGSDNE